MPSVHSREVGGSREEEEGQTSVVLHTCPAAEQWSLALTTPDFRDELPFTHIGFYPQRGCAELPEVKRK